MSTFLGAAIAGLAFLVFALMAFGFVMASPGTSWNDRGTRDEDDDGK